MKRNNRIIVIAVLFTALVALVVSGCYYHRSPEQRAEHVVQHLVSTLKLDAGQTTKLETMKEEFLAKRPDMIKMREESFKDIREMMLSPQIDQARLNARRGKIQSLTDDFIRFLSEKFVELHAMLTPEQRNKLVEEMEKHAEHVHRW